ncbi:MAG TPA: ATP-binding protein [Acidimicrobiales bacterium]|nr:ATP-binding protein [Acidimicrobiales bacterium]
MAVRAGGLSGTSRRRAAAFGAAIALAALGAFAAVTRAATAAHDDEFAIAADVKRDRIKTTLERDLAEIGRLAAITDDPAEFRRVAQPLVNDLDEMVAIALTTRDGDDLVVTTAVPADVSASVTGNALGQTEPGLRIVTETALDEGDAFIGAPFDVDGRQALAVAYPILDELASSEDERRSSVRGAVLGVVDLEAILGSPWPGGLQLTTARDLTAGEVDDVQLTLPMDILGRTWTIAFGDDGAPPPASAWLILGAGLLVAAAGGLVVDRALVRQREAEGQAADRARQLERIAEAGARLQQSLDLSELLPAFTVALAEDFALAGVSVSLLDDDGTLVEAFTTGDPGGATGILELPLRRGWRAVGKLSVLPGRPLDDAERTSLQALADLLAVAMSNAQLYEREQLSAARLRDLDALKNAFLGTVSHELRTSMTAIMGFGELLSDSWDVLDDDRRREMAARIRRSAGSLRHLVDDLLDFARLEQERLRVQPRDIDLAGVVRQTVESLSPLLGNHDLELHADDGVPAWADPVAVERILANLVSNAAKYSPAGTTVTVSVTTTPRAARLVVADQGPGIPSEERRRIFARFYRLSTPEAVRSRGAGIGLAILRDFADRSSAHVEVDDAPGGGARFTVDFPIEPVEAPLHDTLIAG